VIRASNGDCDIDPKVQQPAVRSRSIGLRILYQGLVRLLAHSLHWRNPSPLTAYSKPYDTGKVQLPTSDTEEKRVKTLKRTKPIRVLLMNMPQLLFDMIRGIIVSWQDMRVVSDTVVQGDLFPAAAAARVDTIIIGDQGVLTEDCVRVLYRRPKLKILVISWDGRRGSLHELRPRVEAIEEISAESLTAAIRGRTSLARGEMAPQ